MWLPRQLCALLVLLGCCWSLVIAAPAESLLETVENAEPLVSVEHAEPLMTADHAQALPDTSAITGELTEKLGVAEFFSLWLVFNDPSEINVQTGTEFSILAPQLAAPLQADESLPGRQALVRRMLLDHVVLGSRLRLAERVDLQPFAVTTLGGRNVSFAHRNGSWFANEARVLEAETEVSPSGELVVVDHYLFSDYEQPQEVSAPLVATVDSGPSVDDPVEPPVSEGSVEKHVDTEEEADKEVTGDLAEELSKLPAVFNLTRVPVFSKFLADAHVSQLLQPGEQYTVLFPMDRAFQRWHPIDWGFYPFSVPEFTSEIIRSHFLRGALRSEQIADNQTATTLTNRTVTFRRTPGGDLTANGVPVMRRDVALRGGTVLVVPEVLFVNHKVVQELRKHNRDKETPPLLAFPWWNAQFLSHAFLAIEKNATLTAMERLMNAASDLHLKVPGKNYTFLVPTDAAFSRLGLEVPAWWAERGAGEQLGPAAVGVVERLLLRHLVPGRLYMRQLANGLQMTALDNSTHPVTQQDGTFIVDGSCKILEGDVFVYNLGTMLFVDSVLGSQEQLAELRAALATPPPTTPAPVLSESELSEESGTEKDLLVDEGSTTTASTAIPSTTTTTTPATTNTTLESNDIPAVVMTTTTSTAAPEIP